MKVNLRTAAVRESFDRYRREIWVGAAAAIVFLAACVTLIQRDSPLGHDESVYGLRGRYFADGERESGYWVAYRAPGVPLLLGIANRVFGARPGLDRMAAAAFGLVAIFALFSIVYRLTNDKLAAAVAPVIMVGLSGYITYSTILLIDIPGLAMSGLAIAALAWSFESDWSFANHAIWVVPVLSFFATIVRFGSPIVIAAGALGLAVAFARNVFLSPHRLSTTVKFCGTILLSLLAMLLVYNTTLVSRTKISPSEANHLLTAPKFDASGRWGSLQGFIDLHWPGQPVAGGLISWPMAALIVFAFVGIAVEVVRFGSSSRHLTAVIFCVVSWVSWAAVMNYGLPFMVPQYVMLGALFLAGFVAIGLRLFWLWIAPCLTSRGAARVGSAVICVALCVPAVTSYSAASDAHDFLDGSFSVLRDGARASGEALGPDCVLLTGASPQVGYYSGCHTNASPLLTDAEEGDVLRAAQVRLNQIVAADELGRVGIVYLNRGKRQMTEASTEAISSYLEHYVIDIGSADNGTRQHYWVHELKVCAPRQVLCD